MKKEKDSNSFFEIKNLISLNLLFWSVYYLFSKCYVSLERTYDAICDLWKSICYWGVTVWSKLADKGSLPEVRVTVNELQDVDIQKFLLFDIYELRKRFESLPYAVFDVDNLSEYNLFLVLALLRLMLFVLVCILIWLVVFYLGGDTMLDETDKKNGHISASYDKGVALYYKWIKPVFDAVYKYYTYLKSKGAYVVSLALVWLLSFNVFTIVFEFFAYYFYMIVGFEIVTLQVQILKLIIDIVIMLGTVPPFLWIVIVITAYSLYSVSKGYDNLRHGEAKNCGIVKAFNLCILLAGDMGRGKTAVATDISLSCNNIFKTDTHNTLYKYDMLFPLFAWELYEKDLDELITSGQIYNLPSVDGFVEQLEAVYKRTPSVIHLYNYNYKKYPMEKHIGTHKVSLFDALREYGRSYFVYMNENPNIANYSIRLDGFHDDSPYFKKWCGDFFKPDESKSKYCHILDQDIMRLGKLVDPENPYHGSFGFGIYNNTEWGKSRLNQVNAEGIKKDAEETNQKNDLYEYLIKLVRHASVMIDNKVYFRFIADEQRPESIPAGLRDVVTVVQIVDKSSLKIALPGFKIFDVVYDFIYEPAKDFYYKYRNARGDRTVPVLVLKTFLSALSNFYLRAYNTFGYFDVELEAESGTAYGNQGDSVSGAKRYTYQLAIKKIYSKRYSTDCYQQFFEKKQLECSFGINDYPTYKGLKMSIEEMEQQHDYFLMEIMGIMLGEVEPSASQPICSKKNKGGSLKQKKDDAFSKIIIQDF